MKRWIFLVTAVLCVLAVVAGAGLWWARSNPLAVYELLTRRALSSAGFEQRRAEVAGRQLGWWEAGEGPTVILLHGAGDQAGTWANVARRLKRSYRVVVPDLPGHADSEPVEGELPMSVIVDGITAFVERFDPPVTIVGNSLGAWVAMIVAERVPERLSRIVTVNGGSLLNAPGNLTLTPKNREQARRLMEAIRDPSSPPVPDNVLDDIIERGKDGPIARMMPRLDVMMGFLRDGRLHELRVPVDIVWGRSDRLIHPVYAERMARELPRARLTWVPDCGHSPANECPDRFGQILEDVLALPPPAATEAP